MKCRSCGTEIAEKALICFRCGASVREPVHQPYLATKKRRPIVVWVIFIVLVLAAIVMLMLR